MGIPWRLAAAGRQGVVATITITTCQGQIWMSIVPPFTWEAIMEPETVDKLIHVLELARDEATAVGTETRPVPARKAIGAPRPDRHI